MKKLLIVIVVIAVIAIAYFYGKGLLTVDPPRQVDDEQPVEIQDPSQPTTPTQPQQPEKATDATKVIFYEGNGCSQDIVKSYGKDNVDGKISPNDEARSVNLIQVPAGTTIMVYDSPDAKENDDFATIVIKKRVFDFCIRTFEASIYTDNVEMTYTRKNGLDGKVSYVKIHYP